MAVKYKNKQHRNNVQLVVSEAAKKRAPAKSGGVTAMSQAYDDMAFMPPNIRRREGLMTDRDRKDTYYKIYIACPWVAACAEVISKRFTSGGWEVEEVEQGRGNPDNQLKLKTLLNYINDDEDFLQFLRAIATDLCIYGEAYCEIVYTAGIPVALHKIDCCTMDYRLDKYGNILGYVQQMERQLDMVTFEPEQIIRWWFPDPRASKKALSPIERIKDSVYLYTAMITWGQKFFKQGARPDFAIKLGPDSSIEDGNKYVKWFKENFTGAGNAHIPPVLFGDADLKEFGKGTVEQDFILSLHEQRDTILAGYHVPLSLVGLQETAHLGGGSGESANKAFIYNVVKPIEELILEKLNYRLLSAFKITDYVITVRHADYRDDDAITKIHDLRIRNGSRSIDEVRQEEGKPAYEKGGGDVPVFAVGKEVVTVESFGSLSDLAGQNAQIDLDTKKAQLDKIQNAPAPAAHPSMAQQQDNNIPGKESAKQIILDALLEQTRKPGYDKEKESTLQMLYKLLNALIDREEEEEKQAKDVDDRFFVKAAKNGGSRVQNN